MNWTEGKLARHSRVKQNKQTTALRQREHFAKARAGLLPSASKHGPPAFPLFPSPPSQRSEYRPSRPESVETPAVVDFQNQLSTGKRSRSSPSLQQHGPVSRYTFSDKPAQGATKTHDQHAVAPKGVDENAIVEKKRRLLRESDWAGIRIQKPIHLNFEHSASGEKKWGTRHRSGTRNMRHLIGDRYDQMKNGNDRTSTRHRNQHIKITVGSQQVRLGGGSSTYHSAIPSSSPNAVPKIYGGVPMPSTFLKSSSSVTDPKDKLNANEQRVNGRHSSLTSISEASPHAKDDKGVRRHLKAPMPIRTFALSPITRALDYDAAGSMIAQVGVQTSPLPVSRKEDDEIWRRFAAPTDSHGDHDTSILGDPERNNQACISPGISTRLQQIALPTAFQDQPSTSATNAGAVTNDEAGASSDHHFDELVVSSGVFRGLSGVSSRLENDAFGGRFGAEMVSSKEQDSGKGQGIRAGYTDTLHNRSSSHADPQSDSFDRRSTDMDSVDDGSSALSDSSAQDVDQHVAGLREAALNLINRRGGTPWTTYKGGESVGDNRRSPEQSRIESRISSPKQVQASEDEKPKAKPAPAPAPPAKSPGDDSNDIWFKYVFSDTNTEDIHRQVLDEAKEQTSRYLEELRAEAGSSKVVRSEWGYNMSTAGTLGQQSIAATDLWEDDLASVAEHSASHQATIDSPVIASKSFTTADAWEGPGGPLYASPSMHGSILSSTTYNSLVCHDSDPSVPTGPRLGNSDIISTTLSKVVEPPLSVNDTGAASHSFRFAPPKLFVGKLSDLVSSARPTAAAKPVKMMKPKRGRPTKKARDGRASIKSIPKYDGDPIEEFDEHLKEARVEPSLFGALDTQ